MPGDGFVCSLDGLTQDTAVDIPTDTLSSPLFLQERPIRFRLQEHITLLPGRLLGLAVFREMNQEDGTALCELVSIAPTN